MNPYSIPLPNKLKYGKMNKTLLTGTKKTLRVNADPWLHTGDSHAPLTFYVTTKGYGVYVDNARDVAIPRPPHS